MRQLCHCFLYIVTVIVLGLVLAARLEEFVRDGPTDHSIDERGAYPRLKFSEAPRKPSRLLIQPMFWKTFGKRRTCLPKKLVVGFGGIGS